MPGILPMKVIKVGTSSQSRIAQACDRCRSKKIRCDGIRPCCSQCANVGFECRTSDKLSRRAFPRGYTESLEERVRALEAEVRELKDLLDEKDEKIDMLSKMHSNRRSPSSPESTHASPPPDSKKDAEPSVPKEDTFRVQASPLLLGVENSDSYFMGASSGRSFIESFKRKIQENGKSCSEFNPEAFLHIQGCYPLTPKPPPQNMRVPPRLFSDRCVNVYFQEWAPLFPVLHKPTFLRVYEEFVADPEKVKNNHKLAQLYLVFSIAALSSEQPDLQQITVCETQWQRSLDAILMDNTMITLQCLLLAMMYCTIRADYKRLQHYKGIAVGLSHRLGLHQSQKRFSFGVLTIETRKKVFWTLYMLDCFSAAMLGLPKLLKDEDVHAEYPADIDDEYVTEKGFQPSLPGEHTRLSSALALFRGSRILAKVLEKIYPSATSHDLSLQQMSALGAELDDWHDQLPHHLRLNFKQDKPSTDVTGSRSPLLALAYYYVKILIYRPAVSSGLGTKVAPAMIAVSESSKHIIQIVQLLEERSMSFSFCLNRSDILILCGMALLYQSLGLKHDSAVSKDNEKLANAVIKIVEKAKTPGSLDFKRVAGLLITLDEPTPQSLPTPPRQSPEACMPAPPTYRTSPPASLAPHNRKQSSLGLHAGASVSETDLLLQQEKLRRMTMPPTASQHGSDQYRARSRQSFDGHPRRDSQVSQRDHRLSLTQAQAAQAAMMARVSTAAAGQQNLDYLSLSSTPQSQPSSPIQSRTQQQQQQQQQQQHQQHQPQQLQQTQRHSHQSSAFEQIQQKMSAVSNEEWDTLLGSIENGQMNLYDAIYGGPGMLLADTPVSQTSASAGTTHWSPEPWDMPTFNMNDFAPGPATQSALSLSEESLSSGEDLAPSEIGLSVGSLDFRGGMMPVTNGCGTGNSFMLDGLEGFL
ncbi:fungal-specific transcription factor domain-containing protein [Cercophora newfieldiana]|uniref:Fungal-specific transcription factor domain-containing protein n=1 Tax=Cercophora newfieldiana TaxID=92897 RepID=A0AA39XZB6_9PEZI|nr:fungal-specific transcription factor domain-containing protein [Cercophora newfieldiana]